MTREERERLKEELKSRISCAELLEKSKGSFYKCPYCGSGTGRHSSGAVHIGKNKDGNNSFTCHSCGANGDIIDLYEQRHGCGYAEAVEALARQYGIATGSGTQKWAQERAETPQRARNSERRTNTHGTEKTAEYGKNSREGEKRDFSAYFAECRERITEPAAAEYLRGRGISIKTAAAAGVGFDPAADPAESGNHCPRLIMPTGRGSYVTRAIAPGAINAKLNAKGCRAGIFNADALTAAAPGGVVFVTEGAIDALAVMEAGGSAIATNSAVNAPELLREILQRGTRATLVLCYDNDETGKREQAKLAAQLERLQAPHRVGHICGGCKDPAEALTADRAAFLAAVQREAGTGAADQIRAGDPTADASGVRSVTDPAAAENLEQERTETPQNAESEERRTNTRGTEKTAEYATETREEGGETMKQAAATDNYKAGAAAAAAAGDTGNYLQRTFWESVRQARQPIKTGFSCIDAPTGGLLSGLYALAAAPGIGKTTFCLQLADQLAAAGNDVVFFSLEQSRLELISKSVARYAAKQNGRKKGSELTALAIRSAQTEEEQSRIKPALAAYAESVGNRVSIVEGNFSVDVDYIRGYLSGYVQRTGRRPIVIIDYLQIIRPGNGSGSGKEAIDDIITALKRASRESDTPIITISSINRAGYLSAVEFESLKESGAIEFSCDAVWGLELYTQPTGKESEEQRREARKKAMQSNPRLLRFVWLKNRAGLAGHAGTLKYYPAQDMFTE